MDFSKLSSNDKLAVYGAVATIVGAFLGFGRLGGGGYGLLPGIAMLVIIFLPQFSPNTTLPGSKGSLMLIVGGLSALGALFALLGLLTLLGAFAFYGGGLLFVSLLLGAAGGLLMGWASWKKFQAEGGKFNLGMASTAPPAPPSAPSAPPAPPMAEPMSPPMAEPMAPPMSESEPMINQPSAGSMDEPMGGERSEDDRPA